MAGRDARPLIRNIRNSLRAIPARTCRKKHPAFADGAAHRSRRQVSVMVMMGPAAVRRSEEGLDCIFLSGRMTQHFTAAADALIRLDMGTGGYFLQENLDGLRAFLAFELQGAGGLVAHFLGNDSKGLKRSSRPHIISRFSFCVFDCAASASSVQFAASDAGWSSLAARRAHNPKVTGSNPVPATRY